MTKAARIDVDPQSPVALYLQISERIRRLIAFGALRPGDRLPTVRELAAQTRVNRNTAARAIQLLEGEGLVRTQVGQGTFVEESAARLGRAERDGVVDRAIDRLLVEAQTVGMPFEMLGWRLSRRIESFRREQSVAKGAGGKQERRKS